MNTRCVNNYNTFIIRFLALFFQSHLGISSIHISWKKEPSKKLKKITKKKSMGNVLKNHTSPKIAWIFTISTNQQQKANPLKREKGWVSQNNSIHFFSQSQGMYLVEETEIFCHCYSRKEKIEEWKHKMSKYQWSSDSQRDGLLWAHTPSLYSASESSLGTMHCKVSLPPCCWPVSHFSFPFFFFKFFIFFISLVAAVVRVSFAKSNLVSSDMRATPCRNRPLVTLTFVWVSTAESFQIKNITILFFFLGFYHFLCFLVLQPDLKGLKEGNKGVSKLQTSIKCKFLTLPRLIKPQIFMGFELNSQKKPLVLFFDLNNERILQKKCGKYLFQLLRVWCHH